MSPRRRRVRPWEPVRFARIAGPVGTRAPLGPSPARQPATGRIAPASGKDGKCGMASGVTSKQAAPVSLSPPSLTFCLRQRPGRGKGKPRKARGCAPLPRPVLHLFSASSEGGLRETGLGQVEAARGSARQGVCGLVVGLPILDLGVVLPSPGSHPRVHDPAPERRDHRRDGHDRVAVGQLRRLVQGSIGGFGPPKIPPFRPLL